MPMQTKPLTDQFAKSVHVHQMQALAIIVSFPLIFAQQTPDYVATRKPSMYVLSCWHGHDCGPGVAPFFFSIFPLT